MNLVQFLKNVEDTMSRMSKEQLQSCMRELARTLPENKRQYFLETMATAQQREITSAICFEKYSDDVCHEVEAIKEVLININAGHRCIDSEYNREWGDWYNSDADER